MAKKPFPFKVCEQCCTGTSGGGVSIVVDEEFDVTSSNPIANKVVAGAIDALSQDIRRQGDDITSISIDVQDALIRADDLEEGMVEIWNNAYVEVADDFESDTIDWSLTHNMSLHCGEVSSIIVSSSDEMYALGFSAALYFATPSEIPENYSQFPADIYFKGDSTDNGAFIPEANMIYTIYFDFDGYRLNGYVSGVSTI